MLEKDRQSFRSFVEKLQELRRRPPTFAFAANPVQTVSATVFAGILLTLRELLKLAESAAKARAAEIAKSEQAQAERLLGFVAEVRTAFRKRVSDRLGDKKIESLRSALGRSVLGHLQLAGKQKNENANSDLIAALLDPRWSQTIAGAALDRLVGLMSQQRKDRDWGPLRTAVRDSIRNGDLYVQREVVLEHERGQVGRIDIHVSGPGFLIIIENKVLSAEHVDQTFGYWKWLRQQTGREVAAIFLSPEGMRADCEDFVPMSYLDLLDCLLEAPCRMELSAREEDLLAGYVQSVSENILRSELSSILHS